MVLRPLTLSTVSLFVVLSACGGEPKPAKSADNAGITETSAKEDMPPPAPTEVAAGAPTPGEASAGAAGGVIKLAAMKVTPAKKGSSVELKDDGSVIVDGKPAAKIKGDQVDSTGGTSMLTVGVDGSLVGNGVKPGFKFEGDDVVTESGAKLSIGEDGAITATKDGKSEAIGKADGGAKAKRAALVLAVLYLPLPDSVTKPAKPASPAKAGAPTSAAAPKK